MFRECFNQRLVRLAVMSLGAQINRKLAWRRLDDFFLRRAWFYDYGVSHICDYNTKRPL